MRVKIDMDGVLADLTTEWLKNYYSVSGESIDPELITDWDIYSFVKYPDKLKRVLHSRELFERLDPIEDAPTSVHTLCNRGWDVVIVSDAQGDEGIMGGKLAWLKAHMPFIDVSKQVVFTANKNLVQADVIIDDGPFLHNATEKYKVVYDQPHNRGDAYGVYPRAYSWRGVLTRLSVIGMVDAMETGLTPYDAPIRDISVNEDLYGTYYSYKMSN